MAEVRAQLTVFFQAPFWVGVYERYEADRLEVCKVTFGSEPKTYEVYELMLKHWHELSFSQAVETESVVEKKINPKRLQRAVKANVKSEGVGTKAQEALKAQHESMKQAKQVKSKAAREAAIERKFQLKQAKRKEKHRGH